MSLDYRNCIRLASKYLPKNAVAIDVGCNINPIVEMNCADWIENWNDDFTFLFLEKMNQSTCIGIDLLHWQTYEQRWQNDQRVKLLKYGLSDKDDSEFIFLPGHRHVLSSFYLQDCFKDDDVEIKKIPCKKLDTLALELSLNKIDYLKVDTEGAEYKILCGAKDLLEQKKITFIQFEYGLIGDNIPSVNLICNLLSEYEYKQILVSGREQLWVEKNTYTKHIKTIE